jgi:hypothetical protein
VESGVKSDKAEKKPDLSAELDLVKGQFEDFVEATDAMRKLGQKCRDYKDGAQYTSDERDTFRKRKQPCITDNKILDKVNTMMGLEKQQRTDPKAFPRTPRHEQAAEAATDALRYVADNCDYQRSARKPACDNLIVEGWCYGEVCYKKDTNEIILDHVRVDRGYHDIRSLRPDFDDKKYAGYFTWMDAEDVKRRWKGKDDVIDGSFADMPVGEKEHEDKPNRYVEQKGNRKRLQVFTHCHEKDGIWHQSRWCKGGFLEEPKPSSYKDEDGQPICNIEVQATYRDSEGNCYGYVQRDLDLQDEHNKRRSKLMHLLNSKRLHVPKGQEDIKKMRAEMHKPDGVIEYNGNPKDSIVEDNIREAEGQWRLLEYTDRCLSLSSPSPQVGSPSGSSGRAKEIDQAAGVLPLMQLFDALDAWEIRMYRLAWLCVRQFWTAPMWIRVTDNEDNLKFVGLNQPVTNGDAMARELQRQQMSPEEKAMAVQQIAQDPRSQLPALQNGKPMLDNSVAEMDVDIIISRTQDSINVQAEQFEMLASIADKRPEVPFEVLVEMSQLRSETKKLIKDKISGADDPNAQKMAQMAELMQQLQVALAQANVRKTESEAAKNEAAVNESKVDAAVKVAQFTSPQPDTEAKTQVSVN